AAHPRLERRNPAPHHRLRPPPSRRQRRPRPQPRRPQPLRLWHLLRLLAIETQPQTRHPEPSEVERPRPDLIPERINCISARVRTHSVIFVSPPTDHLDATIQTP